MLFSFHPFHQLDTNTKCFTQGSHLLNSTFEKFCLCSLRALILVDCQPTISRKSQLCLPSSSKYSKQATSYLTSAIRKALLYPKSLHSTYREISMKHWLLPNNCGKPRLFSESMHAYDRLTAAVDAPIYKQQCDTSLIKITFSYPSIRIPSRYTWSRLVVLSDVFFPSQDHSKG